jgi:hypothetical protein
MIARMADGSITIINKNLQISDRAFMTSQEEERPRASDTSDHLFELARKIIGIISTVVVLLGIMVIGLLIFYSYLITQPEVVGGHASNELKGLIVELWGRLAPFVERLASIIAPVFVLIFVLGLAQKLQKDNDSAFTVSKLLSDLPSVLALIIIVTICLLPLAGIGVPDVLNNVALVVVGFYFGKRNAEDK